MNTSLLNKIKDKTVNISIIGLGYVGFPLLELAHKKGFCVNGLDLDKKKVDAIVDNGFSASINASDVSKDVDVYIICVPTPVNVDHKPDLSFVENACETISAYLDKNNLVILESTVSPGTTEEVVIPILEQSGLSAGSDFYVAHCPERIDPGNKKWNVNNIPRVVGGVNRESTDIAYEFYSQILDGKVKKLSSLKNAEATKIVENTFRDINIAFVNELAASFDKIGIDTKEVIDAASTKPFGFLAHYPGCGVGGHCIAVDPYYLIERAEKKGFNHRFLKLAREINNNMPKYTVDKVIKGLNQIGKSVKDSDIAVLGLAYKGGVGDTRESPAYEIIKKLKELEGNLAIYDPYVIEESTVETLDEALNSRDCIVIVTDHPEFKKINGKMLKKNNVKVIIDGRNMLSKEEIRNNNLIYKGIGC